MLNENRETYVAPMLEVVELKSAEIVCESPYENAVRGIYEYDPDPDM